MRFGFASAYTITGGANASSRATMFDGKSNREIWQAGDGNGDPDPDTVKKALSRKYGHPNWKIFSGTVGDIVKGVNEPPYRVYLDDKAAYDISNSEAYSADDRVSLWPFDFAGKTGFIRTNRPNRGRPAYLVDGKTIACKKKGAGWYFFCGEGGETQTRTNDTLIPSTEAELTASPPGQSKILPTTEAQPKQSSNPLHISSKPTLTSQEQETPNLPKAIESLASSPYSHENTWAEQNSGDHDTPELRYHSRDNLVRARSVEPTFGTDDREESFDRWTAPPESSKDQSVAFVENNHAASYTRGDQHQTDVQEVCRGISPRVSSASRSTRSQRLGQGDVLETPTHGARGTQPRLIYHSDDSDGPSHPPYKRQRVVRERIPENTHSEEAFEGETEPPHGVSLLANQELDFSDTQYTILKLNKELAAHRTGASKLRELLLISKEQIKSKDSDIHQYNLQVGKLNRELTAGGSMVESLKMQLDTMAKEQAHLKEDIKKLEQENDYYKKTSLSSANNRPTAVENPMAFNDAFKALQIERNQMKTERDAFRSLALSLYQQTSDQEAKFAHIHAHLKEMHSFFETQTKLSKGNSEACKSEMAITKKAHAELNSTLSQQRQLMHDAGLEEEWQSLIQDAILS